MKKFLKNNFFVLLVSFLLCFITVGYALYGETLSLNGNVTVEKAGVLEITSANIIQNECSNLSSYEEPTYEGLHIEFRISSRSTEFSASYLITITNGSKRDYTYTGFPINAIIEGYENVPVVTSSITYAATGEAVENGDIIKNGEAITVKLRMTFSIERNQGGVSVIVNGDATASEDNSGSITASITPNTGNLKGEGTLAEFQLHMINTFGYQRSFTLTSSNENIEIVDLNGNPLSGFTIGANAEETYTIYLRVKEGSVFLTEQTQTNILVSSNMIDDIDTGTLTLDVDVDVTATDHDKPEVGNVNIAISENNPVDGQATISWNRIDSGGSPIINYYIILYNIDTGATQNFETGNAITSYTVSNLSAGTYYAQVYGIDEAGNSGASDCVSLSTDAGYCSRSADTSLRWIYNITTSLDGLSFDGESTSLIYTSYEGTLSVSRWGAYSLPSSITVTMGGVTLTSGTDYTYDASSGRVVINRVTGDINITAAAGDSGCLVEGTKVLLANGTYKNIEDINYDDLLMVYDHENGGFTYEYPVWIEMEKESNSYQKITFSDGSVLKTVGAHGIFSLDFMRYVNVSNRNEFDVGSQIIKMDLEGNIQIVTVEKIEYTEEEVRYYHVASTRYYNIIANDFITTDGLGFSSYLYSFDSDLTWGSDREEFLAQNDLFTYEEWSMYFPEHLFRGLRMEEAKNIYNHGLLDPAYILRLMDFFNTKDLMRDDEGNALWMVTTSDDVVTEENKQEYLKLQNSYYTLQDPVNKDGFVGWLNTSDNQIYQAGDQVRVIYGMHFIAQYE